MRRYAFIGASLASRQPCTECRDVGVTILVAARNEERGLPHLIGALAALEYPADLLRFVIVSDGSDDTTADIAQRWASDDHRVTAIVLATSGGKASALQHAVDHAPFGDLIVVLDADTVPRPDALAILLGAFDDPRVGAACGYPDPGRDHRTTIARYAAVERWVAHLVTLAGKDRLSLQPSVIGAFFGVRRTALIDVGGFVARSVAEDIDLSQRLTARGWTTRWIGEASVAERVPETLAAFTAQRLRWTRGLLATLRSIGSFEDLFVAVGYIDRVLVLAASVATALGAIPWFVLAFYVSAPIVTVAVALWRAKAVGKTRYWLAVGAMAGFDLVTTLRALVEHVRNLPVRWTDRSQ